MDYWQGVASRVNLPGVLLVLVGAALSFGAKKLAPLIGKDAEKATMPIKLAGLALVVIGALITLI